MTLASEHEAAMRLINSSIEQNTCGHHPIASHNDTIVTGAQLDELAGGGETVLHSHPCGGSYNDRGDPASWDFSKTDFTADGQWHTLDLSDIVPEGATLIHLGVGAVIAYANSYIQFRKNGIVNDINKKVIVILFGNKEYYEEAWVACDANRKIEYWMSNRTWVQLDMVVRGWF